MKLNLKCGKEKWMKEMKLLDLIIFKGEKLKWNYVEKKLFWLNKKKQIKTNIRQKI